MNTAEIRARAESWKQTTEPEPFGSGMDVDPIVVNQLARDVLALLGVVERLPLTSDGVRATPGVVLWMNGYDAGPQRYEMLSVCVHMDGGWASTVAKSLYSTRAAAEAAARRHAMQGLSDQLAPVLALAAEKGVEVVPGWLRISKRGAFDHRDYGTWFSAEASEAIITGSLSAWLAGQGIAVFFLFEKWWRFYGIKCDGIVLPGTESIPDATNHLSALIAAATARLAELPNKENA